MLSTIPNQVNRASKKLDFHLRSAYPKKYTSSLTFLDRQIIKDIKQKGVSIKSLHTLDFKDTADFFKLAEEASSHMPPLSAINQSRERCVGSHGVGLGPNKLLQYPDIFLWGLQERWLNLVEYYFQQPIAYLGCGLRREVPNQRQTGVRLWHRDGEDYKVVKILIYLNDVDKTGGAFEYIPRKISPSYRPFRKQHCLIRDPDMQQVVPQQYWEKCTGPRGTVIIADTVSVFHHATVPQRERLALTFAYTSAKPKNLEMARKFFQYSDRSAWLHVQKLMSSRQKQVAVNWR